MFERFRKSLASPKHVLLYVKDSFLRVGLYLLLMVFLMSIPAIIVGAANPSLFFPSSSEIRSMMNQSFTGQNIKTENGSLIVNEDQENLTFAIDNHLYVIGKVPVSSVGYITLFEEDKVSLYFGLSSPVMVKITSFTYEELSLENIEFTRDNTKTIARNINNAIITSDKVVITKVVNYFLNVLLDYLFIALLLAMLAIFFTHVPLKFAAHFKISVYIMTGWAVVNLILVLFGLSSLYYLTILVAYIYQTIAYRSIRFTKITSIKKDEEDE